MSVENWISLFEASGIWAGSIFVAVQIRGSIKQQALQSMVQIYDINRELLTLGFSHPQLFAVLEDKPTDAAYPAIERRYLQLWLNLFLLIHSHLKESVIKGELRDTLIRDLSALLVQENMQRFWQRYGSFYPSSFQKLVNDTIQVLKGEPPSSGHGGSDQSGDQDLAGNLLKRRAWHPHEVFTVWRDQFGTFSRRRDVALDKHIARIGYDCGRARAIAAEFWQSSVFTNDFINFHLL